MTHLIGPPAASQNRTMIACLLAARDAGLIHADGATTTFSEIVDRARRFAGALVAVGVARGDRVAVCGANTAEFVVAEYGALMAGAIIVPINVRLAPPEIRRILVHGGARVAVYESRLRGGRLDEVFASTPIDPVEHVYTMEALPEEEPEALPLVGTDAPALLIYTSGTTGTPKGCLHTHRSVVDSAAITARMKSLGPTDRILASVPFFNAFGSVNCLLEGLISNASIVMQRSFDAGESLELIERHRVTCFLGTPTMWIRMLEHESRRRRDLSSLRTGVMTGAPFEDQLIERWRQLGCAAIGTYGLTEELSILADGQPTPGTEVRVDETGLRARGISQMREYFRNPEATASARDADGWWDTGDLAEFLPDGRIRVFGRRDDMMICGGFNVYPSEVEEVLRQHESVADAAVVGLPDSDLGQTVAAWIIPRNAGTLDVQALSRFCRDRLAHYKVPKRFRSVVEFPLTANGKIQKFRIIEAESANIG